MTIPLESIGKVDQYSYIQDYPSLRRIYMVKERLDASTTGRTPREIPESLPDKATEEQLESLRNDIRQLDTRISDSNKINIVSMTRAPAFVSTSSRVAIPSAAYTQPAPSTNYVPSIDIVASRPTVPSAVPPSL
jgi:hypothetical protein